MGLPHIRRFLVIPLALFAMAAWAQDQGREFHWKGKLAADQVVEIKDVNGTIEADTAAGDEVEITAHKSGPRAEEVQVKVVPSSQGVTICAIYPGSPGSTECKPGGQWHAHNRGGDQTKVDFTVRMPKNLRFSGQNINGDVRAKNLGGAVRAETVNGSIHVSTSAWAQAQTVNGSIEARMGNAAWDGVLKISTVNGSVNLEMPDDLNAEVKFSSVNGRIDSDFPLTVRGGFVGHSARGTIGKGGRELVISTVNGSVGLKKAAGGI
ncbi:MAG TPA: DUF4097 family beta strand repeat-containing protein [Terriglobales bacterium]|nr:DUF4097 family beta strand repeat-containing protein [Terriglobales bacterium]